MDMNEINSYDDLIALQRKEKKELVAKTQKMKHGVPKDDKKKKKEVTAEISQLLTDLDLKHEKQRKLYEAEHQENPDDSKKESLSEVVTNSSKEDFEANKLLNEVSDVPNSCGKLSKAQKRRNKKAQQQKEREKAIAKQEIENLMGTRHIESSKINEKLSERGLTIYEIPSDGDCLYQAVKHQLSTLNLQKTSVETLRQETAKYLLNHKDDYLPFLSHPETGDILSEDEFKKYCEDISNIPAWGGQVEIKILSCLCKKPIEVIQADGPSMIVGKEYSGSTLIISFHRHAYGLGEHYNSVISADKLSDTESSVK